MLRFPLALGILSLSLAMPAPLELCAQVLVPGTGRRLENVGDDFEDESWKFDLRLPKSSQNLDERKRAPLGESVNDRWSEGVKRGAPDVVQRVATPVGGLQGSRGALLMRSVHTGVPGRPSFRMQQDDLIANVSYRAGGPIPVSRSPSVVARLFLPPVDEWEDRTGPTFAFRASCITHVRKTKGSGGLFGVAQAKREREIYWPGLFIDFQSKTDGRDYDSGSLRIRGNRRGRDRIALQIRQTGWWTLGMSFTPDGQVHFFARPGIEDLRAEDHLASEYPYGYRCEALRTFFFDVCSADDGRTVSTPWVVDDAFVYVAR